MKSLALLLLIVTLSACSSGSVKDRDRTNPEEKQAPINTTALIVLGTIQDAGSPQIGCRKECCLEQHKNPDPNRMVVSLGLFDAETKNSYLFEATPDITRQVSQLNELTGNPVEKMPHGVFLTHAHIGHYTGLMYFGKEAISSREIPVHAMPRMSSFLATNGPWNQLVSDSNIVLKPILSDTEVKLSSKLFVTPILVPHRDEFSETVGYIITGPKKKVLFIPDINKWHVWEKKICELIRSVDYAFLDATFFDAAEINNRDISEIPHPFVVESFETFQELNPEDRKKVHFIHFNHTNPIIDSESRQAKEVIKRGFNVAQFGQVINL